MDEEEEEEEEEEDDGRGAAALASPTATVVARHAGGHSNRDRERTAAIAVDGQGGKDRMGVNAVEVSLSAPTIPLAGPRCAPSLRALVARPRCAPSLRPRARTRLILS